METREKLLMDIKYMTEKLNELTDAIKRGNEALNEKINLEKKIDCYMNTYLRLREKEKENEVS